MSTHKTTAAPGHRTGGLELPEDWLAWKPFGYARKVSLDTTLSEKRAPLLTVQIPRVCWSLAAVGEPFFCGSLSLFQRPDCAS